MKKVLFLIAGALITLAAHAIPAVPHPIAVTQPDGTRLMVKIHGDEFFNYKTTVDGYTVVQNNTGYYVYATKQNEVMVPTALVAHNEGTRSAAETAFLSGIQKNQFSNESARQAKLKRAPVDAATKAASMKDYSNFKGLIVLVDYYDCYFSRSDMQQFYYNMANAQNYTGFTNEDGTPNTYGECTGSVRDYYFDNSQGLFDPTFDVVGPVRLTNYSVNDHHKMSGSAAIWAEALRQIDSQVDFTQYDTDNDGNIDMIFFIGAGSGSNSDGSTDHLWPHKYDLYWQFVVLDQKRARTYACSTEFLYDASYGIIDGIGTICHEFSHVLGLPDLYDTDYADGGGQSQHPGNWDIMSGGSYQNNSRTPVAYSLYDRYSLGFANAQTITQNGTYQLNQIGSTGDGYILPSGEPNVKFYIENRQNTKWDTYAPGHGMIICRVDSTNSYVWNNNDVNCDPSHNYYVLLRAGNGTETEQESDAFPTGATYINNTTTPNLKTFNGTPCQFNISDIQENNGLISFKIGGGPTTLATMLDEGVDGEEYIISDDLAVVDVADYADKAVLTDGEGNWIMVTADTNIFNQLVNMSAVKGGTLKGTLSGIELNPVLTITAAEAGDVVPEFTIDTYYLSDTFNPKVNQVIDVIGYWNAANGALRAYQEPPQGPSLTLDTSWGAAENTLQNGKRYKVRCAMNIKEPWHTANGIGLMDYDYDFQNYIGYAMRLPSAPTAIDALGIDSSMKNVNVYNMQGQLVKFDVNAATATQGLHPGIYLIGGKKVIVK